MNFVLRLLLFFLLIPSAWAAEWYLSWGYSKDYWTDSNIHISQPSLNNNFTIYNVAASDDPGWNSGLFNHGLFVPQYNIRVGRFVNAAHTWAVEFSFDHTKYNSNLGQVAYVDGTINGQPFSAYQVLSQNYFSYLLHNGVNHIMLNAVRRIPIAKATNSTLSLAGLVKVGAGIVLPHASNVVLGNENNVGPKASGNYVGWHSGWWQFDGWTAGVEAGLRFVVFKPLYLELTDKEAFTSFSQIPVYEGRANQLVWLNEVIFSIGVIL